MVHVWLQYAAPELAEGGWEQHGASLGELAVAMLEEHDPGFSQSVRGLDVQTPADLERRLGATDGCLYHAELALDQLLYMRPLPGWFDYDTPVPGLHLCGSGCHGGGGMTALPGRNAAQRVLAG